MFDFVVVVVAVENPPHEMCYGDDDDTVKTVIPCINDRCTQIPRR